MAFNNTKIKYPQCFIDKVEADLKVSLLKRENPINFAELKKAKLMQDTYRLRCQNHIVKQRGNDGSGGIA